MSQAKTETKSKQLINRVYEIGYSGKADEVALQRVAHEAKPLAQIDPINYEFIMGGIACLRGQEAVMRKHYHNAIKQAPEVPESYFNYANSLVRLSYDHEALSLLDKALELDPNYEAATDLRNSILAAIEEKMWADMEEDTEEDLLGLCMNATSSIEKDTSCGVT